MSLVLFCSSELRVKVCRMQTNLCCLSCQHVEDCLALCRSNNYKVVPCEPDDLDEEDQCPNLV